MSWRQGDGYLQSKQSILLTSLVIAVYIAIELHVPDFLQEFLSVNQIS